MVFHKSLSVLRFPGLFSVFWQISSIWMVSTHPLISNSSGPFTKSLGIAPNTPTTIDSIVTLMFDSFLSSLARSKYFSIFPLSQMYPFVSQNPRGFYESLFLIRSNFNVLHNSPLSHGNVPRLVPLLCSCNTMLVTVPNLKGATPWHHLEHQ